MDTVTQALLGMAVGQAVFGRRLRGQALLWGAVGGALPDLDTLVAAPFGSFATLVHHRGISHSLLFGPVVGSLLGYAFWRRRVRHPTRHSERLIDWMGLWVLAIVTHPLLDLFTTYGTQLLAPLSNHRFAVNGDPPWRFMFRPEEELLAPGADPKVVLAVCCGRAVPE